MFEILEIYMTTFPGIFQRNLSKKCHKFQNERKTEKWFNDDFISNKFKNILIFKLSLQKFLQVALECQGYSFYKHETISS